MKTVLLSEKIKKIYDKFILNEGQEVKSLKKAIQFVLQYWNGKYKFEDEEEAEAFLRTEFREKCGAFHNNKEGKFYLGAVRLLYNHENDSKNFTMVGKLVKYIASNDELFKENDINLSNFGNLNAVEKYVNENVKENDVDEKDTTFTVIKNFFRSSYKIVPIKKFDDAKQYEDYTDWCICRYKRSFDTYTNGGDLHLYFVLTYGYDDNYSQDEYYEHLIDVNDLDDYGRKELFDGGYCSWDDEYALSMLAVFVNSKNELTMCVGRYNHDVCELPSDLNGYTSRDFEHYFTQKELSYILGGDFKQLFPYEQKMVLSDDDRVFMKRIVNSYGELLDENDEYRGKICGQSFKLETFGNFAVCNVDDDYDNETRISFIITPSRKGYGSEILDENIYDTHISVIDSLLFIPYADGSDLVKHKILDEYLNVVYDGIYCNVIYVNEASDGKKYIPIKTSDDDDGSDAIFNILNITDAKMEFKESVYGVNLSVMGVKNKDVVNVRRKSSFKYTPYSLSHHKFISNTSPKVSLSGIYIDTNLDIYTFDTCEKLDYKGVRYDKFNGEWDNNDVTTGANFVLVRNDKGYGIIDAYGKVVFECGKLEIFLGTIRTVISGGITFNTIKGKDKFHLLKVSKEDSRVVLSSDAYIKNYNDYIITKNDGVYRIYYYLNIAHDYEEVKKANTKGETIGFKKMGVETFKGNEAVIVGLSNDGKVYRFHDNVCNDTDEKWDDIRSIYDFDK